MPADNKQIPKQKDLSKLGKLRDQQNFKFPVKAGNRAKERWKCHFSHFARENNENKHFRICDK